MKTLIITLVSTIIGGLAVVYFTSNKPELAYTLSDPLQIELDKGAEIFAQQLEIKNIGSETAKKN